MKKSIFLFFIISFWGCTTLKPDSSQVSEQDINKRVEIENPHYYQKLNGVGYGSMVAATAAGAYAGYQTKAMKYNDGTEQKTLDVGNALIGAAVGFTLSYYANRLLGWGKTKPASSNEEWLKKANKNYVLLNSDQSSTTMRAIHSSVESMFKLENLNDAQDFARAFRNSPHTSSIIDQAVNSTKLSRSNYAAMAEIFSRNSGAIKLKKEYIRYSSTVAELFEGVEKFPNIIAEKDFQARSSNLITNIADYKEYKARFKGLEYDDKIFSNIYKNIPNNDLTFLIRQQPKATQVHTAKVLLISKTESITSLKSLSNEYGSMYLSNVEQKAERLVLGDRTQFEAFISSFPTAKRLTKNGDSYHLGNRNTQQQPDGVGMLWDKSEKEYQIGTFVAGKLSGYNCEIDKPNYNYRGGMVEGKKSGQGKENDATDDGYTYEGGFSENKFFGNGEIRGNLNTILSSSGSGIYTGGFENGLASGVGKLQQNGKEERYEGGFKKGSYDGVGTILSNKEYKLFENGSGNRVSAVNRQVQGTWKEGNPNGKFKFSVIIRKDVLWGWLNDEKKLINHEGNAFSWNDLKQLEQQFIQKADMGSSNFTDKIAESGRQYRQEQDSKEKQREAKGREEEAKGKLIEEEKDHENRVEKELKLFLNSVSLESDGIVKDLWDSFSGKCPCEEFILTVEKGLFTTNDKFEMYRDSKGLYYKTVRNSNTDVGPFSYEGLLNYIYEKHYKPKRKK